MIKRFGYVSNNTYICTKTEMYQDFRKAFFNQKVFSAQQVKLVFPGFNVKNFTYWLEKGYIVRIRNGWYSFQEHEDKPEVVLYAANRIYQPSYISLHYALNFYGLIPEFVARITSVSTLKTQSFSSYFGNFSFQNLKPECFFGYEMKKINNLDISFASPEKALLDLFYLYPMYNTPGEIDQLRLDTTLMKKMINIRKLDIYTARMSNRYLTGRIELMKKTYDL